MTQLEAARQGIITKEMETAARDEGVPAEYIRQGVAEGTIVIPANIYHKSLHPYAIGDEAVGLEEADLILVCRKIYTHEMKEEFYTDKETYERWNSGRQAGNNHSIYMGEIVKVLKKC